MSLPFLKMHGLGNDFVVIDARSTPFVLDTATIQAIADRRRGVGCDQLILLRRPKASQADIFMDMYNADGSIVRACGNATRCVASLMFDELKRRDCLIETVAGFLSVREESAGLIAVDFGEPRLAAEDIPLRHNVDTLHVALSLGEWKDACCVNMGNPHAVFFVPEVERIRLEDVGPKLETDPLFPDRCNIEIAQILSPSRIRMRVWERGTGLTQACGSGACATLVAAVRRGLSERRAAIVLDGGELTVEWRRDGHVILLGPAALSFRGEWNGGTPRARIEAS